MPVVYSTMTNANRYTLYKQSGHKNIRTAAQSVEIAGRISKSVQTPKGAATSVTAEQLDTLKTCPAFNRHLKNGFLSVDEKQVNAYTDKAEEKARNMESEDKSIPLDKEKLQKKSGRKVKETEIE